jgi:HAD superfamily hydrolase (TIGR01509 family)
MMKKMNVKWEIQLQSWNADQYQKTRNGEYFKKYLAMDDRSCFRDVLRAHGRDTSAGRVRDLVERKAGCYGKIIKKELKIFSGVKSFVQRHRHIALAVVSGALRREIDWILKESGLSKFFSVIISTEDVRNGKPDPECYRRALERMNRLPRFRKNPLRPGHCLAIEDSIHGIQSARKAHMKCMGVTNSYSREDLHEADIVVGSLEGIEVGNLKL